MAMPYPSGQFEILISFSTWHTDRVILTVDFGTENHGESMSRRYITSDEAPISKAGRWGPRRMQVDECWAVVKAEDVYDQLLDEQLPALQSGATGVIKAPTGRYCGHRDISVAWEVRANALWRFGRVFLRCPRCRQRVTRIYLPVSSSEPACRTCYGLTYESRQRLNYKARGFFGLLSWSDASRFITLGEQRRRRRAARARQADRAAFLNVPRWNTSR
jgi:hypothetical protein